MDLPAIATEAAALLAGYALAIGRDVADKASTAAADRLFGLVKDKFAGDSEHTQTLGNLVREPTNGEHQEAVAAALSGALEDDPSFGEQLWLSITEVKQSYGEVEQTITTTGPVAGNQIVSNIGSGTSISDSIVNNQGSVDQSVHTTHDQRRITNKRGAGALWPIGVAVGLVIAGITTLAITTGTDERIQGTPTRLPQVGATDTAQASTTPVADPPLEISSDGTSLGVPLEGNYAVHDGAAYFVEGDEMAIGGEHVLVAAELATGERRWSLPVRVDSNQEGSPHMIEVTDANGEPMVFLVALVTTEGTGTSVDRTVKQVTAVSAVDGRPQWTYDYTEPEASPRDTPYKVVSGSHMVIADGEQVVILDPSTGKQREAGAVQPTLPPLKCSLETLSSSSNVPLANLGITTISGWSPVR